MADDPKPHPTDPDPIAPLEPASAPDRKALVTLNGTSVMPQDPLADPAADPAAAGARPTIVDSSPAGARAISNTLPDALELLERTTLDDGASADSGTVDEPPAKGDRSTMDDVIPAEPPAEAAPGEEADGDDDDGDEPGAEPQPEPPKKKRRLWPYFLIGTLLLIAMAAPIAYILVFRYDPTAVKHIPTGTVMALRIDAKELYLWKPFRDHVVGKIDGSKEAKERGARLKKLTGIDLTSDLREIVVATPDGVRWVVLVGGYFHEAKFNRADVVKGLKTFLEEQGGAELSVKGGILYGPNGLEVTQAEDSTIILSNDHGLLQAATPESDEWTNLGLAGSGGMSFVITETALQRFKGTASQMMLDPAMFGHSKRVSGFLKLGGKPQLSIEIVPRQVNVEVLSNEIEGTLGSVRGLALLLMPDTYGMKRMIQSLKVKPRSDVVMLTADWPYDGLEDAMKAAGDNVERFASGQALLDLTLPSLPPPQSGQPVDSASPPPSAPPPELSAATPPSAATSSVPAAPPQPVTPQPYVPPTATPTGI